MKACNPPKKINPSIASLSLAVTSPNQSQNIEQSGFTLGTDMFMRVSIDEIDTFEHNPRRIQDTDVYNDIKESIKNTGIQQPVHITRRPGESRFVLAKGGNTRLQIMKELYQETQDHRFKQMPCIYVDFESDRKMKIAHLIENEQRQDMCFWDKACAYQLMCNEIQAEYADELSIRDLALRLSVEGLQISNKTLNLFVFAHKNLVHLDELAFSLSNPKTTELRKFFHELKEFYGEAAIDEVWPKSLNEWASEQIVTAELDANALIEFVRAYFTSELGEPDLPKTETEENGVEPKESTTDADIDVEEGMSAETDTNYKKTAAEAVTTTPLAAVNTVSETPHTPDDETTDFDEVNPQQNQEPSESQEQILPPKTREVAQKELHSAIRKLLKMVNLSDCFKTNEHFPVGFYMEYPAFEHLSIPQGSGIYYPVDALHEDAGNVFAFMCHVSGQEQLMTDLELGSNNPFLTLPNDSKARIAYDDDDKCEEFNGSGIGERPHLIVCLLEWQTQNHPLSVAIENVITHLKALNTLQK